MPSAGSDSGREPGQEGWFATTHWSVVLAAGDASSPDAAEALERLCRVYWYPLYAFVRRKGHEAPEAEDLTQGFFERLLKGSLLRDADRAKGRFRSFLLGALKHHLSDERDRRAATKRGGGKTFVAWDSKCAEERLGQESAGGLSPDQQFERNWAVLSLERVVVRARGEYEAAGKSALFDQLKLFLWGELDAATYAELARQLGMTEAAVKMAASRLRRRCRELLRDEVAQTVEDPGEVENEMRYLISVLRG